MLTVPIAGQNHHDGGCPVLRNFTVYWFIHFYTLHKNNSYPTYTNEKKGYRTFKMPFTVCISIYIYIQVYM